MKKDQALKVLIALIICLTCLGLYKVVNKPATEEGDKTITITIKNGDKEVGTVEEKTNANLLSDALIEMEEEGDIQLKYTDSDYGMYIQGLGIDKLIKENSTKGKYWTYESSNNKACVANGFCDAASNLAISDGDEFTFTLGTF